jgi:glycosyltransferase involved in cell wall biosynthesis
MAVIVHGEWSVRQLMTNGDPATIYSMPLGIEHPLVASEESVRNLLQRIRRRDGELVLVAAGILGHSRRLDSALQAMAQADLRGVPVRLVLCGSLEPGLSDYLLREAARLRLSDRIVLLGSVSDEDFAAALLLADVVVHMHYPTSGQTSSTVLRALSAGKPVLVSDTDAFRDLADDVAWKVPTGSGEVAVLAEYLVGLTRSPELRAEMGRRAIAYIESQHTWERVVQRFLEIVSQHRSWFVPRRPPYKWPVD